MKPIPYGRQSIDAEDIAAVTEVLQDDFLTQGPRIANFEEKFAEYIGTPHAVAVSNGTAALHLAVMALGLQPGQKVITTPITFAASANCVRYEGGEVHFADIDPETALLDPKAVRKLLEAAPMGTYKGLIPVDFAGYPTDLVAFRELADEFNLWLLEDACHAPGGSFTDAQGVNHRCGDSSLADAAIFSFHPVKHIACGEGGMVTMASAELADSVSRLRTHGITKDPAQMQENHGGWYYEMVDLGYNYRLTDMQAALGITQLAKAEAGLARRREIAQLYDTTFAEVAAVRPLQGHLGHAYHLYVIRVADRKGLYDHLRSKNIYSQVHYEPVHLQPYYRQFGWKSGDLPLAEAYYEQCLSLPMYPTLTAEEQAYVIQSVMEYVGG